MFRAWLLGLAVLFVLLLSACSSSSSGKTDLNLEGGSPKPFLVDKGELPGERAASSAPADPSEDYVFSWDLIAGQNTNVGTVDVSLSDTEVCVDYNLTGGWTMTEAHLFVGTGQPDPKGAPGQFPYGQSFSPAVSTWSYCVDLADLGDISECCQKIYVATHAAVKKGSRTETAWGGKWNNGSPSYQYQWSKKWGGYFSLLLLPNPSLPGGTVQYSGAHYGAQSYWGIAFDSGSFPSGSYTVSPAGNSWAGWCVDRFDSMFANSPYSVTLYSSYDSSLPSFASNPNWDKINYMLTQRHNSTSAPWSGVNWSLDSNKDAFQEAVWWYSDGVATGNSLSNQFIADAEAHGDNFVAHCGDFYAVILYPGAGESFFNPRAQMNIVEVECN